MKGDEEMKVRVSGVMLICMVLAAGLSYAEDQPTTATAQPPTYLPPEQRPIIAVMPFEDGAIEGDWGWWYGGAQWSAGTGISDMIASELIIVAQQKQNFRMVERERLHEVLAEQDLGTSGRVDPATAAQVGQILGAGLLVMGSVTRFDVEHDAVMLPFKIGVGGERWKATAVYDGRLVDTTTSELLGPAQGGGSAKKYGATIFKGGLAGLDIGSEQFQESILGKAARQAARGIAVALSGQLDQLSLASYVKEPELTPGLVVSVEGGTVMINRGLRDGVQVGDVLLIKRKKQEITDPETGEVLKVVYDDIGTLMLAQVEEKISTGTLVPSATAPGPAEIGDAAIPASQG